MSDLNNLSEFLPADIFGTRYKIEREINYKRGKRTYLAKDVSTDDLVVIKLLIFNSDFTWDDLKLFEREAETLKSLSHPAIPQYLDYLEIDTATIKGFALIQTYIAAASLAEHIASGRTFSETEVKEIARSLLKILEHLHSRQPTVIHRDIKPSNILLGDRSGNSVGQIYLIDFGSVQNLATKKNSTITVVGTYGYMPPEQFGGRVKPASDLYSLGATLIYLVTGKHPADLPETDLRIEFEDYCNLSPGFIHWLKQVTNPSLSSRLSPASKAIEELGNCEHFQDVESKKFVRPPNSKISINKNSDLLKITIPGAGIFHQENLSSILFIASSVFLILFAVYSNLNFDNVSEDFIIILFLSFLVDIHLLYLLFVKKFSKKTILINSSTNNIAYRKSTLNFKTENIFQGTINRATKISKILLQYKNKKSCYYINILTDNSLCQIYGDSSFPILPQEIDWLTQEISDWINIPVSKHITDEYNIDRSAKYYQEAYSYYKKREYLKAIELYDLAIQFDTPPFPPNVYVYKAICNLELKNYQAVVENCNIVIELEPDSAEAYQTRGQAYYYLEHFQKAVKDLNLAIAKTTKIAINDKQVKLASSYYLAAAYIAIENYREAINVCDRALEIDSQYADCYWMRANAYLGLNNYQNAIKDCERAIELDSEIAESYTIKGLAYYHSGNFDKSIANLSKAIDLKSNANNYYNLGLIQFSIGYYSESLNSLNSCLKIDNTFKFAYFVRSNVNYELDNYELARRDYNKAIKLEPKIDNKIHQQDGDGYYAKALAKYQIGKDKQGAIQDLEKVQEIAQKHQHKILEQKAIALLNKISSNKN